MDELDDAKKELKNAAIRLENGAAGWRAYVVSLNGKLNGTLENKYLDEQIKILSQSPRVDPSDFNTKKILFE